MEDLEIELSAEKAYSLEVSELKRNLEVQMGHYRVAAGRVSEQGRKGERSALAWSFPTSTIGVPFVKELKKQKSMYIELMPTL